MLVYDITSIKGETVISIRQVYPQINHFGWLLTSNTCILTVYFLYLLNHVTQEWT